MKMLFMLLVLSFSAIAQQEGIEPDYCKSEKQADKRRCDAWRRTSAEKNSFCPQCKSSPEQIAEMEKMKELEAKARVEFFRKYPQGINMMDYKSQEPGTYVGGAMGGMGASLLPQYGFGSSVGLETCSLSADEKEISCANGKVYVLSERFDQSLRENSGEKRVPKAIYPGPSKDQGAKQE